MTDRNDTELSGAAMQQPITQDQFNLALVVKIINRLHISSLLSLYQLLTEMLNSWFQEGCE